MVTAIETQPGTDPDRAGFATALEAARDTVTTAIGILPNPHRGNTDLAGHIGAAVLTRLLPPRRLRYSVRTSNAASPDTTPGTVTPTPGP